MERLTRQVQETEKLLSTSGVDWKDCSLAITELADAVESLEDSHCHKEALRLLMSISTKISSQLASIRSKLVKDTCECLLRIVMVMGQDFQDMANALLPQIIGTAKMSSTAIRQPGSRLLRKMSEVVRYDLSLMREIYVQAMQDKAHVLVLEQLRIIFVFWSDDEVLQYEADVFEMIRRGLEDQNEMVRKTAREALADFSFRWSERVDELADLPSNQSKALLVSEHRDSPLADAILKKYPKIINKSDSFSRSKSRFGLRKFSLHKREQTVEVYATETTPPKQREDQELVNLESVSTGTIAKSRSPRKLSVISRLSFDDPDFLGKSDENQHEGTLAAFDGSQMHKFRSELSTPENLLLLAPKFDIASSPPLSSRSRSSSASTESGGKAVTTLYSDQTLESSRMRSSISRTSSPSSKKPIQLSPSSEDALLSRPCSPPLETHGSSGLSSPVRSAKLDEEMTTSSPLSASDEFFSKQLPSSIATPNSLPTDNVTLRSRRRVSVCLGEEDLSLRAYDPDLSMLGLPPQDRLQQAEAIPESIVCESLVSPVLAAGSAFDEVDGADHSTAESDYTDFRYKRDGCEGLDEFVVGADQLNLSAMSNCSRTSSCSLPEISHLDEGFTNKFETDSGNDMHLSTLSQNRVDLNNAENSDSEQNHIKAENLNSDSHDDVRSAGLEYRMEQRNQGKACEENDEVDREDLSGDTFAALLNVCQDIKSLREATRNVISSTGETGREECMESIAHHASTATAAEELPERSVAMCTVQYPDEPVRLKSSYLEQLNQADQSARRTLVVLPVDDPNGQDASYNKGQSLSETFEPLCQANDDHESIGDDALLALQTQPPSPLREIGRVTVKNDEEIFNSVEVSHFAGNGIQRAVSDAAFQETSQNRNSCIAHVDQASRFDAAEKLFADKTLRVHDRYNNTEVPHEPYMRPNLPERLLKQVHYPRSKPRYAAPTRMGAKCALEFECDAEIKENDAFATKEVVDTDKEKTLERATEQADEDISVRLPTCSNDEKALLATTDDEATPSSETSSSNDTLKRSLSEARQKRPYFCGISLAMFLSAIFCIAGLLHAAKKVNESHEYHFYLKSRIDKFEESIAESHSKVLKLENDYSIWTEYVRKLAEEDEANALTQLQVLHAEVQQWQQDMHDYLVQFRKALTTDAIDAALANFQLNESNESKE